MTYGHDDVLRDIETLYERNATLRAAWDSERAAVAIAVDEISADLKDQYQLGDALGVGGSGIVIRVSDVRLGVDRALKFSRPSPGKQDLLAALLASESERLMELSHPYLMRVHARGQVEADEHRIPYYVMDLFSDVSDADDYVKREDVAEEDLLQLLERVLEAVTYMHSQGQVHLDIKPGNILVRPGNQPVISDLGFAKVLQDDSGMTFIGGTEGFIHPDARDFIMDASSDPNRLRGEAARAALRPTWDLYSLGRTILLLLRIVEKREPRPLSLYTHRYLKLLACRLLDGKNGMDETLLGLSRVAFGEIRYDSAGAALLDLRKLTGAYNLETRIPELDQFGASTIQASTFSTTPFTHRVKALLAHEDLARLGGFTQLSLLNLVYPTATHTRLEHAIGTFSAMCRYITALHRDPSNPLFRQIMTEEDILAALLIALVHDVGHYALAHDLEEADRESFSHETRGQALLTDPATGLRELIEAEYLPTGERGWEVSVDRLIAILDADVARLKGTVKDRLIHSMIDGPIDADKLDYIIRDSNNLGLTYGSVIDVERLLRVLTVVCHEEGGQSYVTIGIHEKGRVTAEAVAFARYALYGSVYWHHAYRGVKAMVNRIGLEYLESVDERDKKSKKGIHKSVTEELYPALRPIGGVPQSLPFDSIGVGGQLHPGDKAVLTWIAGRCKGDAAGSLAELVETRRLFKRVLVLSRWGDESLWQKVTDLMSDRDWRRKLRFQRNFQQELASAVEHVASLDAQTSVIVPDARNAFLTAARAGRVLVLVDAAQPRPGAATGLEVIEEEDRRRARIDELPTGKPEPSSLWTKLRTDLHESLGKVRVMCHPDHARFISALNRETVEDALRQAERGS